MPHWERWPVPSNAGGPAQELEMRVRTALLGLEAPGADDPESEDSQFVTSTGFAVRLRSGDVPDVPSAPGGIIVMEQSWQRRRTT